MIFVLNNERDGEVIYTTNLNLDLLCMGSTPLRSTKKAPCGMEAICLKSVYQQVYQQIFMTCIELERFTESKMEIQKNYLVNLVNLPEDISIGMKSIWK